MILAGLIMAGFSGLRGRARNLKAKRNVAQLKSAWDTYYAEYSGFPEDAEGNAFAITESGIACIQILRGRPHEDDSGDVKKYRAMNPKNITYMDFHQKATEFNDPWGHKYRVALDSDYDGQVSVPVSASVPSGTLRMSVAAWSLGADGVDSDDDMKTWR
jgi:type II secretory pathway pseudopilin PulG